MSLLLEGTLEDIRLADLLRLIAREKRTGALRVTVDGAGYRLLLADGYVTGARAGEDDEIVDPEATVLCLIRHRRGAFQLLPADESDEPVEDPTTGLHAEMLAGKGDMELMRLEEQLDAAGSEAGTPKRDAFPTPKQMDGLDSESRTVFGLIDGERDLAEVVLRSKLDPASVLEALDRLSEESLVKLDRPVPSEDPLPELAAAAGGHSRWLDGLAAVVPLVVLLSGLGFVSARGTVADPAPFEIHADPLAAARAAYEVERLRSAVEAHRFVEGRWPEALGVLAERGYVPEEALTDARGRPYYYAVRDGGFVLLAPER